MYVIQCKIQFIHIYLLYRICRHILLITFFNEPELIFLHIIKCFQVLLCLTNDSIKHQCFVYTHLNDQTVLFLPVQFSISHLFTQFNFKQFYLTLSGATTPGLSGLGSDGNKEVLCIPGISSSDCLVSYWDTRGDGGLTLLQRCSQCILQPQLTELSFSAILLSSILLV